MKKLFSTCLIALTFAISQADALSLRKTHPTDYTVKEGDTLWSIASTFLDKPWEWGLLWKNNPSIKNPDALYPGDVISLNLHNGHASLQLKPRRVIKLSPSIRSTAAAAAVPSIPLNLIAPFLNYSLIVSEKEFATAPYIVGFQDKHLLGSDGLVAYARGVIPPTKHFGLYHRGAPYLDPQTGQLLGFSAIKVGSARVVEFTDPAVIALTDSNKKIERGDFLLPTDEYQFDPHFNLQTPAHEVQGQIVSLLDGLTQTGPLQVVVLNLGQQQGMQPGDVLSVIESDRIVTDPYHKGELISIPNARIGDLLVFRVFDQASFALIMQASNVIHLKDRVTNPG